MYGVRFDGSLKSSIKSDKSVEDALAVEDLREVLEALDEQVAAAASRDKGADQSAVGVAEDVLPASVTEVCRLSLGAAGSQQLEAAGLGGEEAELLTSLTTQAARLVAERVKLVDGRDREATLADIIRSSAVGQVQGGDDGNVVVVYDTKLSGEDRRRPSRRPPAVRKMHAEKMIRAVLRSRLSSPDGPLHIVRGDVYCLFDAGRSGTAQLLMSPFTVSEEGGRAYARASAALRAIVGQVESPGATQ